MKPGRSITDTPQGVFVVLVASMVLVATVATAAQSGVFERPAERSASNWYTDRVSEIGAVGEDGGARGDNVAGLLGAPEDGSAAAGDQAMAGGVAAGTGSGEPAHAGGSGDGSGVELARVHAPEEEPHAPEEEEESLEEREAARGDSERNEPARDDSGASEPPSEVQPAPDGPWAALRTPTRREPCLVRANRLHIATGRDDREPTGIRGPYLANGEPIVVFMDMANDSGSRQEVGVVWTHEDPPTRWIDEVRVGTGSRWRTWAERPLPLDRLGRWEIEVVDEEGCLVGAVDFELGAPSW